MNLPVLTPPLAASSRPAPAPLDTGPVAPVAQQQPDWPDQARLGEVRDELSYCAGLVRGEDVSVLRSLLALAAQGRVQILQAGDCAEDPAECVADSVMRKVGLLDMLGGSMRMSSGLPVLRVGRIAGQFAKPRSRPTEFVGDQELPVYRGHLVNDPAPDPESRVADPDKLLLGYMAARQAMGHLGWLRDEPATETDERLWTSHEALLLDYETPLVREEPDGRRYLASTHWPLVGERTRQVDGAHVDLLASIANPVSCKVGPSMTTGELLELCAVLDPDREPGRLTLIARFGVDTVADRIPELVRAVREAGHPVIWLVDPMHGNTVASAEGLKTRFVDSVTREVVLFQQAVRDADGVAGGIHLECTPHPVTECVQNETVIDRVAASYTSFCDPRLNPDQAMAVVDAWDA